MVIRDYLRCVKIVLTLPVKVHWKKVPSCTCRAWLFHGDESHGIKGQISPQREHVDLEKNSISISHLPGDSSRDLFIPNVEGHDSPFKGSLFHHPKKVAKNYQDSQGPVFRTRPPRKRCHESWSCVHRPTHTTSKRHCLRWDISEFCISHFSTKTSIWNMVGFWVPGYIHNVPKSLV